MNIPPIETLTSQEVFEHTARFLFEQGEQSLLRNGQCVYRGDGDRKCAAGIWIRDEDYREEMEGCVRALIDFYPEVSYMTGHTDLLEILQALHDNTDNWKNSETMREAVKNLASINNLDASFVDNLAFRDR